MCPSSVQAFIEEELAPELLDFTEELLLESVEEFDFAEEELFFDEDWALLLLEEGLDGFPPLRSEDESAMELLVSFSGSTNLLLSSSPQATNKKAESNNAAKYFTEDLLEPQSFLPNLNYKKRNHVSDSQSV